jgi:RNA polymerase sigma-70 factor, ECF subfamily
MEKIGMTMASHSEDDVVREFVRQERMLREFLRGLVCHSQDAEDVFQETAVVILRKGGAVENMDRFPQWCRSIARNMARNYWRKKGREKLDLWEDFSQVVEDCYSDVDSDLETDNERRRVMDLCVERLPGQSQRLLKMFYVEGIGSEELARRLKRSAGAIRVALLRVREAVHNCVELRMASLEGHHHGQ